VLTHSFGVGTSASIDVSVTICDCLGGGTGARIWPAGIILAEWLARSPLALAGKDVLELGAGTTGFPSIVASHRGARAVATDGLERLVCLLKKNMSVNAPGAGVQLLDWKQPKPQSGCLSRYDVVLFADAVYSVHGAHCLCSAALDLVCEGGAIIGALPDNRDGIVALLQEFEAQGLRPDSVALSTDISEAAASGMERFAATSCIKGYRILIWRAVQTQQQLRKQQLRKNSINCNA